MAMWDKLFKKKDEDPRRLNPIVQKSPMPAAPARVSTAKPVARPPEPPPRKVEPPAPVQQKLPVERETKSRKKPEETKSRRPTDAESFLKRGLNRQAQGEHAGAIEDFTQAIELDGNLAKAYAARGVSRETKGDAAGAKSDYSKSIQIEIMSEINRQMRENPDVEM